MNPNFTSVLQIIAAIGTVAAAIFARLASNKADAAKVKVEELHVQINSRFDEFMRIAVAGAHAAGKAEGVESERKRADWDQRNESDRRIEVRRKE